MTVAGLLLIILFAGVSVFLYVSINYAKRKFRQMDLELERRTEAASLTMSELKALLHETVNESIAELLARVEKNEQRLEALDRHLKQPELPQLPVASSQSSQSSTSIKMESELARPDAGEVLPTRRHVRSE